MSTDIHDAKRLKAKTLSNDEIAVALVKTAAKNLALTLHLAPLAPPFRSCA